MTKINWKWPQTKTKYDWHPWYVILKNLLIFPLFVFAILLRLTGSALWSLCIAWVDGWDKAKDWWEQEVGDVVF